MPEDTFLLSKSWHKTLSLIHQLLAGICFVSAVALMALLIIRSNAHGQNLASLDLKIYKLFNGFFSWSFYGIVFTALLFSIFTKWGFIRYKWIIVKWVVVAALIIITMFAVSPVLSGLVALRSGHFSVNGAAEEYSGLGRVAVIWLAIEVLLLAGLKVFSRIKPWSGTARKPKLNRKVFLILSSLLVIIFLLFLAVTYLNLQRLRNMAIDEPDLQKLENGKYVGRTEVGGFPYIVEVTMADHRIQEIKFLRNQDNVYGRWAEGVIHQVLKRQTLQVDAITGATTTSKALLKTVSNALKTSR